MQNSKKSGENPNANPFEVLADAERHVGRYNTTPFSDIGGFKESFSDDDERKHFFANGQASTREAAESELAAELAKEKAKAKAKAKADAEAWKKFKKAEKKIKKMKKAKKEAKEKAKRRKKRQQIRKKMKEAAELNIESDASDLSFNNKSPLKVTDDDDDKDPFGDEYSDGDNLVESPSYRRSRSVAKFANETIKWIGNNKSSPPPSPRRRNAKRNEPTATPPRNKSRGVFQDKEATAGINADFRGQSNYEQAIKRSKRSVEIQNKIIKRRNSFAYTVTNQLNRQLTEVMADGECFFACAAYVKILMEDGVQLNTYNDKLVAANDLRQLVVGSMSSSETLPDGTRLEPFMEEQWNGNVQGY